MLVAGLVIEREVLIEAPPEVVWRTITEPDQMSEWFADRVDLVVEPALTATCNSGTRAVRSSSRWSIRRSASHSAGITPAGRSRWRGNSMLVEFTLTPEGDERTRLRVAESGHELRAWPDAEKQRYAAEHRDGWAEYLDRLARTLATGQSG